MAGSAGCQFFLPLFGEQDRRQNGMGCRRRKTVGHLQPVPAGFSFAAGRRQAISDRGYGFSGPFKPAGGRKGQGRFRSGKRPFREKKSPAGAGASGKKKYLACIMRPEGTAGKIGFRRKIAPFRQPFHLTQGQSSDKSNKERRFVRFCRSFRACFARVPETEEGRRAGEKGAGAPGRGKEAKEGANRQANVSFCRFAGGSTVCGQEKAAGRKDRFGWRNRAATPVFPFRTRQPLVSYPATYFRPNFPFLFPALSSCVAGRNVLFPGRRQAERKTGKGRTAGKRPTGLSVFSGGRMQADMTGSVRAGFSWGILDR